MSIPPPATEPRHDFPRVLEPEWEAMMARGEEPEMPDWVAEGLDQIKEMIADGTAHFVPWEQMKAELQREFPNT